MEGNSSKGRSSRKTKAQLSEENDSLRRRLRELEQGHQGLENGKRPDQPSEAAQRIYKELPIGLCYFDTDLRFRHINDWLAALNGLSVEDHLGRSISEVLPRVAAGVESQLRHVIETGEPILGGEVDAETPAQPGVARSFHHDYLPVRSDDGTVVGVSCIVEEITERKHREQALHEAQENYRHIFENANFGIYRVTPDGRPIHVNPPLAQLNGYDSETEFLAAVGDVGDGWYVEPDRRSLFLSRLNKDGIVANFDPEIRRHKTGERIWVSENAWLVRGEDGEIVYYEGTVQDITERKMAERRKSEFVSTVSHELRTPLTSIHGSLGLIKGGAAGILPGKLKSLLDIAYNNSNRLVRLIDDILDIEKFEFGKMEVHLQPTEVMPLIEQAVEANKGFADERGVKIVVRDALPGVEVQGDEDRLMQVMANLLSNAVKFSSRGDAVEIGVSRQECFVRVGINDNGPGIPKQFRDRIFDKYSQADASDSRQAGGTGLGLSICKTIVEKHGGDIGIDTEDRKGSTFFFRLPELCEREDDQSNS